MSYFEECLTLGQWLSQEDRRALYKFLLTSNELSYKSEAKMLLEKRRLTRTIANGEIYYFMKDSSACFVSRKLGSDEFTPVIREMKLGAFSFNNIRKLKKFFAQSEVDVLSNFPLPGSNSQTEGGFSVNTYPYYSLDYYSRGMNRLIGLVNKIQTDDTELLKKLRAL